MSDFDLDRVKCQLRSETGVEYFLAKPLEVAAANRALGRGAHMRLIEALRCVLVGYHDEANKLLRKAKEWLEYAIGTQEKNRGYFRYGTEAGRHEDLALCNWLLCELHDRENLDAAVRNEDRYITTDKQTKANIAIILPVFLDAGNYEKVLSLFEQYWDDRRPRDVRQVRSEAAMSYILAASRTYEGYSQDEVGPAFDSFLRNRVPAFLDHGNYTGLARWLKIAFWNDNPDRSSAFETVRKCYDYLPNVTRPQFNS